MTDFVGKNLARLMAARVWSVEEVAKKAGLHRRTIQTLLSGARRPHLRTVQRLAAGLDVSADEFFVDPSRLVSRRFDRETNPIVQEVIDAHPELFARWREADYAELHSRMATGGPLTVEGTIEAARCISRKQELIDKLILLLETGYADLVEGFLEMAYHKVRLHSA